MEKGNAEVHRFFVEIGRQANWPLFPKKNTDYTAAVFAATGEPDYRIRYAPGRDFYCEDKWARNNEIRFDQISPEQHEWLLMGPSRKPIDQLSGWAHMSWLFLWTPGSRPNSGENPRMAYLIPWLEFYKIEQNAVQQGQASMPVYPTPRRSLSIFNSFPQYRLLWGKYTDGGTGWIAPETHSFWRFFDVFKREWSYNGANALDEWASAHLDAQPK